MELRGQCVLPSNAPALPSPTADQHSGGRGVLQERSANRRHHDYSTNAASSWQKRSSSPTENLYTRGYFTGNLGVSLSTQLGGEKTEAQIEKETERLWNLLQRCEKYQKYRERQPTQNQNLREKARDKDADKDQKWPNFLERAFFKGLVRWPPMGRRKHMLDGQLRGRNELVADSIYKETGIPRTRKQVSSHIQVLKNILSDQPGILVYMSTEDIGSKGHRHRHGATHAHHLAHLRKLHTSKYDYAQGSASQHYGSLPSSVVLQQKLGNAGDDEPTFTVSDFAMFVHLNQQRVHDFTALAGNGRASDLNVVDTKKWHQQYAELNFLPTEDFKDRRVLVCDASVKVMIEHPPSKADLSINFNLHCAQSLSHYESIESITRFYDKGELADQIDDKKRKYKETRTKCEIWPDTDGDRLNVKFGSGFWVHRMLEFGASLRAANRTDDVENKRKIEADVRRELQYLTATQDIYATKKGSRDNVCFLTILWRFRQTRGSAEPGRMNWRIVNFGPPAEHRSLKNEGLDFDEFKNAMKSVREDGGPGQPDASSMYQRASHHPSGLGLDFHPTHPYEHLNPPPLDIDTISSIQLDGLASEYSQPNSATDYSQTHSIPSLTHSQDTVAVSQSQDYHDANEFDFNGGHITISGCLEPAINLSAYDYSHAPGLNGLSSLAGLENEQSDHGFGDLSSLGMGSAAGVSMPNYYSTKPSWHHTNLISNLEGAAEQYHLLDPSHPSIQGTHAESFHHPTITSHSENIAGHGVLHDGQLNSGLWKLQSAFGEDTGVGAHADHGHSQRKDSHVEGHGSIEILEMIERDQRRGEDRYRGY